MNLAILLPQSGSNAGLKNSTYFLIHGFQFSRGKLVIPNMELAGFP